MDSISLYSSSTGTTSSSDATDAPRIRGIGRGRRRLDDFSDSDGVSLSVGTPSVPSSELRSVRSSSSDYWEDGLQVLGSLRNTYSSSRSASPEPTLSKPVNLKEDQVVMERCGNQRAVIKSDQDASLVAMETPITSQLESRGISSQEPEMETSYLRLKPRDDHPGVVEYQVKITPYIDSTKLRRRLLRSAESMEILGEIKHFDGLEKLVLPLFLPHDMTFETSLKEDQGTLYKVSVTFTRVLPIAECTDFFYALLRKSMRRLNYKEIDGLFCDVDLRKTLDEHRVEIWPGISLAGDINEDGMVIKVGIGNLFVGQDSVLDYVKNTDGELNGLGKKIEQLIVNMKVLTKYNYKCYTISEVAWDMHPDSRFWSSGQLISLKDYVERNHKVSISNVTPPMLIAVAKRMDDEMGVRYVALIPECCHITGLTDALRGNEKLIADVLGSDELSNAKGKVNVDAFVNRVLGDENVTKFFAIWGLILERNMQ